MSASRLKIPEIIRDTQRHDYALSNPQLAGQFSSLRSRAFTVDRELLLRILPPRRLHLTLPAPDRWI
jgi:hypothetical protein